MTSAIWNRSVMVLTAVLFAPALSAGIHGPVTFDERAKIQEAIKQVYHDHSISPTPPPHLGPPFAELMSWHLESGR